MTQMEEEREENGPEQKNKNVMWVFCFFAISHEFRKLLERNVQKLLPRRYKEGNLV